MASQEKILELLAEGKVSPAEAESLLSATGKAKRSTWQWVVNPLSQLSTGVALTLSVMGAAAGVSLWWGGIRFDGALDVHVVERGSSMLTPFVDLLASWPLAALVLWGVARISRARGRFVDFLSGVGLARLPLVAVGVLGWSLRIPATVDPKAGIDPKLYLFAVLVLPLIAWSIIWMVMGYRTASGLRGPKFAVSVVGGLIAAELFSKLLIRAF